MIHHLTERDTVNRTAVCAVDGPVRIYRAGRGWVCATKHDRLTSRSARRGRQVAGRHQLGGRDLEALEAYCTVCEKVVGIVPWGRGYVCSVRAAELGRLHQQEKPQTPCRDCLDDDGTWINLVDDECPRCAKSLNLQLLELAATERELADADIDAMSFSILGHWADPYKMPDNETAVPGWKTLGSRTAAGIGV